MKTISATDAKNKFGDLMNMISAGPVAITKNNKVVAVLTPSSQGLAQPSAAYLDTMLAEYSTGAVSRKELEEATGLWFGEILVELSKRGLTLPRVDAAQKFNEKQRALFDRIFQAHAPRERTHTP